MVEGRDEIARIVSRSILLATFIGMLGYIIYLSWESGRLIGFHKEQLESTHDTARRREEALTDSLDLIASDLESVRGGYDLLDQRNKELTAELLLIQERYEDKINHLDSLPNDSLHKLWAREIEVLERRGSIRHQ